MIKVNQDISIKKNIPQKLTQPPYSCFRPTNTTVATEATMVASKPNVVATAAIRNHKVNGGPGMYFSILAKIKNMMTNIANFVSKSQNDNFFLIGVLFRMSNGNFSYNMGCVNTFLPLFKISGCPFGFLVASEHRRKYILAIFCLCFF